MNPKWTEWDQCSSGRSWEVDQLYGPYFLPVDTLSSCHSEATEPHLARLPLRSMCFHFSSSDRASVSNPQRKPSRWPVSSSLTRSFTTPYSLPVHGWYHGLLIFTRLSLLYCSQSKGKLPQTDLSSLLHCERVSRCLAARQLHSSYTTQKEDCGS